MTSMNMDGKKPDDLPEDEESLKLLLLREEIAEKRRSGGIWKRISDVASLTAAASAFVAAIVALTAC